ncbi:O-unit flippase [Capnocytophaga sp. H4358]|uniref:flippase n=1 Tax=Capnocytophaga sp. H4358 TaxID=1945658 RepID=UPI000BB1E9F6|nr:flippase [Capnocytophaga sp. H4358]ATA72529.1 O-unit flippase [Capnocytophaga sp. H4358]
MITKLKNIVTQEGFVKYFKNTSWLLLEKIIRMGLGLFVSVWITRYLGKEQFGTFSYVQSLVGIFSIFTTLGLDSLLIREFVDKKIDEAKLFGTVFILRLLGTIFVYVALFLAFNYVIADRSVEIFVYVMALTLFFQIFQIFDFYFKSRVITKYFVIASTIAFVISIALRIYFIQSQKPLIYFLWAIVVEAFVLALFLIYFYIRKGETPIKRFIFDKHIATKLLGESWPWIISAFVLVLYLKMDQLMLKHFLGDAQVGIYAAASKLSEIWAFVPTIVCSSLFPAIINAKSVSEEKYYNRLQALYDLMVWGAILLAIPITLLADNITNMLYGQEYVDSSFVLKVHIWTGIFTFFGSAWFNWVVIEKYQKTGLYMSILSLIANFVMNYFVIPIYGAKGAVITTLITYSLSHIFFALFFENQKKAVKMFWNTFNLKRIYYEIRSSLRS